jgi:hypothetical protein
MTIPLDFELQEPKLTECLLEEWYHPKKPAEKECLKSEILKNLPAKERKLLQYYADTGKNYIKLARKNRSNYEAVRKQIYRLKRGVYAKYYRHLGMIGSLKLLSAQLNESIRYCVKRLNVCMMNNEMHKLKKYFGEEIDRNELPDIDIKGVFKYDIIALNETKYQISVYYRNSNDEFNCFMMEFYETNKHVPICITKLPKAPSRMRYFNKSDLGKETTQKVLAVNKTKGTLELNSKQREEILKKYKPAKVIESKTEPKERKKTQTKNNIG